MYKKMEKALTRFLTLLTVVVMVLVMVLSYKSYQSKTPTTTFFLDKKIVLHTGEQMEPEIKKNSLVLVEKLKDEDDLKTGSVYFYEFKERTMIARYHEMKEEGHRDVYFFKGDGQLEQYPAPIERDKIYGIVKYHMPLKTIVYFLLGLFVFIRLILLALYKKDAKINLDEVGVTNEFD